MDFSKLKSLDAGEFRDPISQLEIMELGAQLSPYELTAELVSLFGTFDGWEIYGDECECFSLRDS